MGHVHAAIFVLLLTVSVTAFKCKADIDCQLLGQCNNGVCECRQGFTGPECAQLDLAPAPNHLGYLNETGSTWGGRPVKVGGEWHFYVSMMAADCPLGTFNNNSEIAHLVSIGPDWRGPYEYVDTVVVPFAHNAAPQILPDGSVGIWFIGYNGSVDVLSCPGGTPPPDDVWPDWTGKQIAMARSPPHQPSGPWSISWLFDLPVLPDNWWHWDCSATNPSALVQSDGSVKLMYRGTMCTHCSGCPSRPGNTSERLGIATARSIHGPYTRAPSAIDLGNASIEVSFVKYCRSSTRSFY